MDKVVKVPEIRLDNDSDDASDYRSSNGSPKYFESKALITRDSLTTQDSLRNRERNSKRDSYGPENMSTLGSLTNVGNDVRPRSGSRTRSPNSESMVESINAVRKNLQEYRKSNRFRTVSVNPYQSHQNVYNKIDGELLKPEPGGSDNKFRQMPTVQINGDSAKSLSSLTDPTRPMSDYRDFEVLKQDIRRSIAVQSQQKRRPSMAPAVMATAIRNLTNYNPETHTFVRYYWYDCF